jgi:predicted RecB family nuclease
VAKGEQLMNLPEDFMFSQSNLQNYFDCQRRFELMYLKKQRYPASLVGDFIEYQKHLKRGEEFHRFVHQHLAGVPSNILLKYIHDEELEAWFKVVVDTILPKLEGITYPETTLSVQLAEFTVTAKYDLLVIQPNKKALILDWKTVDHLPKRDELLKRLQTIVYRYVLARGGSALNAGQRILPEHIELKYCYVAKDGMLISLPYSQEQYEEDEAFLLRHAEIINTRPDFPMTEQTERCRFCQFRSLCNRGRVAGKLSDWLNTTHDEQIFEINFDDIEEVEF